MAKTIQKNKTNNSNKIIKIKRESPSGGEISNLILENTVALQRNLVETTDELKNLNIKLTRMLDIFDKASRTFEDSLEKGTDTDIVELEKKIDALTEQNRIIAKGLLLLGKSARPSGETKVGFKTRQQFNQEEDSEEGEEDKSDYSF